MTNSDSTEETKEPLVRSKDIEWGSSVPEELCIQLNMSDFHKNFALKAKANELEYRIDFFA